MQYMLYSQIKYFLPLKIGLCIWPMLFWEKKKKKKKRPQPHPATVVKHLWTEQAIVRGFEETYSDISIITCLVWKNTDQNFETSYFESKPFF